MDAQQFLAEFGHIANAPNGVQQLRDVILSLSMQGKLIAQDLNDAPSAELISNIEAEKIKLIKEKKIRPPRPFSSIKEKDVPYQLPTGWLWSRLGIIANIFNGNSINSQEKEMKYAGAEGRPYIATKDVGYGLEPLNYANGIAIPKSEESFRVAHKGAVLVCAEGGSAGKKCGISQQEICFGNKLFASELFGKIPSRFILYFYLSPLFRALFSGAMTGMIGGVSTAKFAELLVPVPPINEQSRIVAKVDELMALCDTLEEQQQVRRKLQNTLRQSTLQALASASSPYELQTTWTRLSDNFGQLFHAPEDVRQLRDVVFDLALRGVFLPDSKLSPSSDFSDVQFGSLPIGWEWKTLADLSEYITSGSRGWKTYIATDGDSFIRSQDIKHDALIFESPAFVNLPDKVEGRRTLVRTGDLLLTITGGNVGRCAIVPELSRKAYVSQHVALIRLLEPGLSEFIHFWMINAFGGQAFLARYIYGDKPGLNLTQVGSVPIPVPPDVLRPEILESLRRHQEMCDGLSTQLRAKQNLATALAAATISAFTGIAIQQQEDHMKAPQNELIAPLRLGMTPDIKAQAPLATILARQSGDMSAKDLWQRFGGGIDAFYAQLKTEVSHGWILEPGVAEMREKQAVPVSA